MLREEVQKYLALKTGERVIDATLGLGGHSLDIVKRIGKKGLLYAFEQDSRNLEEARKRLKDYQDQIEYLHDNFRHLKTRDIGQVDAVLFDLGLSSPHVDDPDKGFSFLKEGPLDMRFDSRSSLTAQQIINTYSEAQLADIFFHYGEERMSRVTARKICEIRKSKPFTSTTQLAQFIETVLPVKNKYGKPLRHPATKIFQALRIAVNDELNALKEALVAVSEILKVGGRVVIISYHSLEDRIVKKFFQKMEKPEFKSMEKAVYQTHDDPIFERLTKKPIIPSEAEIRKNPRSRSAKLRAYRKVREA